MENLTHTGETAFLLKFDGKMTYAFYRELEDRVIDAMRRYKRLEIDLSKVTEIDLCGLHLVGLLLTAGIIVATSDVVERASRSLIGTLHAAAHGCAPRSEHASINLQPVCS
ncbi:hypothetical protein [Propionivibrio sp.]|uniref:hypothetical protein n=1 Tax=Propionivibrio sp. TaxID=2212460 RepID=UPI003BF18A1B